MSLTVAMLLAAAMISGAILFASGRVRLALPRIGKLAHGKELAVAAGAVVAVVVVVALVDRAITTRAAERRAQLYAVDAEHQAPVLPGVTEPAVGSGY